MIIKQKVICREDLVANRDALYLFGDNDHREGMGGQAAAMRHEPNALGVRTKVYPSIFAGSFWSDMTHEENCYKIDEDLRSAFEHSARGYAVIIPLDGLGTGRAKLEECAPLTFKYLQRRLEDLCHGES